MFSSADNCEVDVHDSIRLLINRSAEIRRTYTFTNDRDHAVLIRYSGQDALPKGSLFHNLQGLHAKYLGMKGQQAPTVVWEFNLPDLEPSKPYTVELFFNSPNFVNLNPLALSLNFTSLVRVRYSFSITPCFRSTFSKDQCEVKSNIAGVADLTSFDQTGVVTSTQSVIVSANRTGPFSLSIKKQLPEIPMTRLMSYYSNKAKEGPSCLDDKVLVLIPHLLRDSLSYIAGLQAAGLEPDKSFIIGIPYSTKAEVVNVLWERGFTNLWTPSVYPFSDVVKEALKKAINLCKSSNQHLLILEDGGYAGPLLHRKLKGNLSQCIGVVEQTRNGIWQYGEQRIVPKIPILNIAECRLKLDKESPLIGKAVVFNMENLLQRAGWGMEHYHPLVVGFGSTGKHVAEELRQRNLKPIVFDLRPRRRKDAGSMGFVTGERLKELLPDRNLIIGCTGKEPFQFHEITALQHRTTFVNASSKRRELNYRELRRLTKPGTQWEKVEGMGTKIQLVTDRELVLLADGYPVNFVGESVPDEEISFIVALLQQGAIYVAKNAKRLKAGFRKVPTTLQKEIAERHQGLSQ